MKNVGKVLMTTLAIAAATLTIGCSGAKDEKSAAKDFAITVLKKMNSGDKQQLAALYPDASKIDSFIMPDTTAVNVETSDDSSIKISFGKATMELTKNDKGEYIVKSSKGLLGIPEKYKPFAYATGWIDSTLTDADNAVRLKDEGFPAELKKQAEKDIAKMVVVKGGSFDFQSVESMPVTLTVINNSDNTIKAGDYSVNATLTITDYEFMMGEWIDLDEEVQHKTLPGKELPPHGKAVLSTNGGLPNGYLVKIQVIGSIKWNTPLSALATGSQKFTGKEYSNYLKAKGGQEK